MPIPLSLKPKYEYDLIRIGSRNDGGYLIEKNSLFESEFLLSFGISTDWSFEKEFIGKNNVNLKCFDGSIDDLFWLKWKNKAIKKALRFSFREIYNYLITKLSFQEFFNTQNFACFYIGKKKGQIGIDEIINEISHKKIFFKIDIEGSEYEILDQLIKHKSRVSGIAIEFHDCDKNIESISDFIKKIDMPVVHIHANNYDPVNKIGIPKTIEITFSYNPSIIGKQSKLPHKFDMPNKYNKPEIKLEFSD